METDIEVRKRKIATVAKVGIAAFTIAVLTPAIFILVQGLAGIAIAGVLGLTIINVAPVLSMKFANWKLRALKNEARANPIETREQLYLETVDKLGIRRKAIEDFNTGLSNFRDKIEVVAQRYPMERDKLERQLQIMQNSLNQNVADYELAVKRADEFRETTEKAKALWEIARIANNLKDLNSPDAQDALNKILADESLDSVQSAMNSAMSQLELNVIETQALSFTVAHKALPVPDEGSFLEQEAVRQNVKERVR